MLSPSTSESSAGRCAFPTLPFLSTLNGGKLWLKERCPLGVLLVVPAAAGK
jgi:hypothetical protein